jgi:hypothetical protein
LNDARRSIPRHAVVVDAPVDIVALGTPAGTADDCAKRCTPSRPLAAADDGSECGTADPTTHGSARYTARIHRRAVRASRAIGGGRRMAPLAGGGRTLGQSRRAENKEKRRGQERRQPDKRISTGHENLSCVASRPLVRSGSRESMYEVTWVVGDVPPGSPFARGRGRYGRFFPAGRDAETLQGRE